MEKEQIIKRIAELRIKAQKIEDAQLELSNDLFDLEIKLENSK